MAALISLQGQRLASARNRRPALFAKLDTDGDGQISQSEFETALGSAGVDTSSADALFAKLDANGDGSISQSELASANGATVTITTMAAVTRSRASVARSSLLLQPARTARQRRPRPIRTARPPRPFPMPTAARSKYLAGGAGERRARTGGSGAKNANLLEQLIHLQAQLLSTGGGARRLRLIPSRLLQPLGQWLEQMRQ